MMPTDLTHRSVYRLARTVTNPTPDKRRRGNHLNTTETWPEGLLVYAFVDTHTAKPHSYVRLSARGYYNDLTPVHEGFAVFVDALEPVRTLDSVLYGARESMAIIHPAEILAELIEAKLITLENVEIAATVLIARSAAEREASTEATTGGLVESES